MSFFLIAPCECDGIIDASSSHYIKEGVGFINQAVTLIVLTIIHQVLVIHCHTFMNKCVTAKKQWSSLRQNPCDQQRRRQKADPVKVSVLISCLTNCESYIC